MMTEGWIERVNLSSELQAKLSGKSPTEKASLYASEGIWYDALQILADLRRTQPTSATQGAWQNLLQSVELNSLVTEPVLPKDNTTPNVSATR
jgi:hypothetical protein